MALIKCTECSGQVSDRASACPHCGCPLAIVVQPLPAVARVPPLTPTQPHLQGLPFQAAGPAVRRPAETSPPPVVAVSPSTLAEPGDVPHVQSGNDDKSEDKIGCLAESFWLIVTAILAMVIFGGLSVCIFGDSVSFGARPADPVGSFSRLRWFLKPINLLFLLSIGVAMIPYLLYLRSRRGNGGSVKPADFHWPKQETREPQIARHNTPHEPPLSEQPLTGQ